MDINPELISPCALYCGVCAIFMAHRDNNDKFKARLVNLYKGEVPGKGVLPNSENLSIEDMECRGCLSDKLFMHCRQCGSIVVRVSLGPARLRRPRPHRI
jgi:hypothetical protein